MYFHAFGKQHDNLLKQLIDAEDSDDLEKMLALMTDDVVIEDVPFGMYLLE